LSNFPSQQRFSCFSLRNFSLESGAEVFGKDRTVAQYEKRIRELEQLLGRKEVEIALLRNFVEGSS